jgi:predicted SAM-dependent methyltransferase
MVDSLKLDLACGNRKTAGFVGVDCTKTQDADIVHDLNKYPYPFEDNSVDEINCQHFVEHVDDLVKFMDECWRILKPEAKMNIVAPYYANMRAWQDPTHKRAISESSFLYFNKQWRIDTKLNECHPYNEIKSDFDFSYGYNIDNSWANRSQEARDFAIKHYINVVNDVIVTLTKRKP